MMLDKTVRKLCTLHEDCCCLTITDMRGKIEAYFLHETSGATMHYSSRCEEFVPARFLNNSQKNIKKSSGTGSVSEEKIFQKIEFIFIR